MSAFVKIPLQALILLTGVLVFVFFLFHAAADALQRGARRRRCATARARASTRHSRRSSPAHSMHAGRAAEALTQAEAGEAGDARPPPRARRSSRPTRTCATCARAPSTLVKDVSGDDTFTDVNYVFPTFVIHHLPIGLVGLMIAAIFAAAMSSIAAELNALATASVIDIYRRHLRPEAPDAHYLRVSKWPRDSGACFACIVALYAARARLAHRGRQQVRVVLLRVAARRLHPGARLPARERAWARSSGLIAGIGSRRARREPVPATSGISYLWYNVVGAVAVTVVGLAVSATGRT